jgi:hypothetical protein
MSSPIAIAAQQGAARQVERARRGGAGELGHPRVARGRREVAQLGDRQRDLRRRVDHLGRRAALVHEAGPQHLVAANDLGEALRERRGDERPAQPQGERHVEVRRAGDHPLELPERLLRERQRQRRGARDRGDR